MFKKGYGKVKSAFLKSDGGKRTLNISKMAFVVYSLVVFGVGMSMFSSEEDTSVLKKSERKIRNLSPAIPSP